MTQPSVAGETVVITHPIGLHARPAVKLTRLARTFQAEIAISRSKKQQWVDAKSIVRVMGLKVKAGETLCLRAVGPDARRAVKALADMVKRDFRDNDARL